MLDAVKWLDRIVDELSHKRRKELYQEWLRDWTMTGAITYEINLSEIEQMNGDPELKRAHLAREEYKVALQLASQMVDPAVMDVRTLPSKPPVMKRELLVVCLRTRAATPEKEEPKPAILNPHGEVIRDLGVSNLIQFPSQLRAVDNSAVTNANKSLEALDIKAESTDKPQDTPMNTDDSEPPPKSCT